MNHLRVVLGGSGAPGAGLSLSIARQLTELGVAFDLVVSQAAHRTLQEECGATAADTLFAMAEAVHSIHDPGARIASGSVPLAGMIVAPCSMRSLAAIACGLDDTLLTRAASVHLKERRRVVLLTREAPLTRAHIRNMGLVTDMGGIILPPVPAFYLHPQSVADIINQIAARAIDLLGIAAPIAGEWSGGPAEGPEGQLAGSGSWTT